MSIQIARTRPAYLALKLLGHVRCATPPTDCRGHWAIWEEPSTQTPKNLNPDPLNSKLQAPVCELKYRPQQCHIAIVTRHDPKEPSRRACEWDWGTRKWTCRRHPGPGTLKSTSPSVWVAPSDASASTCTGSWPARFEPRNAPWPRARLDTWSDAALCSSGLNPKP